MKKIIALILAITLCAGIFVLPSSAVYYRDDFPNTHRNTGKNLQDFIAVTKTQIGYTELSTSTGKPLSKSQNGGYTKYGAWFGAPTVAWCAFFVSWCSNQAGISSSVIPRIGNCEVMTNWYKNVGRYFYASQVTPRTGDLIFYNWAGGKIAEHIGIVTGVSGNNIYTVEGNTGSSMGYRCEAKTRTKGAKYIVGYARPAYNDALTYVGSYSFSEYAAMKYRNYNGKGSSSGSGGYTKTSQLAVITGSAEEIKGNDATLIGRIDNSSSYSIGYAGFYFGKDKNNLERYGDYYGTFQKKLSLKMQISKRYGKLKPATKYYYCSFVTINGRTYKGPVYSLTTVDDVPKAIVLSDETAKIQIGETYEILSAVLPAEAQGAKVKWTSDNTRAVTVKDGMLTGISAGYATVTAKCDYGNVSASCNVEVALAPVSEIDAKNIANDKIEISWKKEQNPDVFGFEIYRCSEYDGEYEKIGEAGYDKCKFTDNNAELGEYYYYKIRSINAFEDLNSEMSDAVGIRTVPAPPASFSVEQNGIFFRLSWKKTRGVNKYSIYRSEKQETGYKSIGTVKSCLEFFDFDIICGKTYYYKICAVKGIYNSEYSDCRMITAAYIEPGEKITDIFPIVMQNNVNLRKRHKNFSFI